MTAFGDRPGYSRPFRKYERMKKNSATAAMTAITIFSGREPGTRIGTTMPER